MKAFQISKWKKQLNPTKKFTNKKENILKHCRINHIQLTCKIYCIKHEIFADIWHFGIATK